MLQHLLLGFVVLIGARAGKQAVHASMLGGRHCYVLALDLEWQIELLRRRALTLHFRSTCMT